ncbi:class I SAM-dependent methyltransferase [Paenibacillus spongiae]|uniref:Class I SAM-dependent methyltransferase n=1 Tax=Paenibacillus spongiae TaxID=2909671 RepID=A0ABY5SCH3_9BACL|nr:class I SAM-dependent methyltransferase [Paenibacillus spongiae]UVI30462.1 class I SAM-dependent methyltransferase [Paenibacillus spongiae]
MNNWTYDEFKHCGVDYADPEQAEIYDSRHQKFRNDEQEFAGFLSRMPFEHHQELTLLDMGCGTGAAAIHASKHFRMIYAVDVSEAMLQQARRKAEREQRSNIEFIHSGFLSYEHRAEPVDIVSTKVALHHLPDFWKQIALMRMNAMLKMGGILYLHDVIFHFRPAEYQRKIDRFIAGFEAHAGKLFKAEVETHIRDEFSTFDWIMEGMMARAGFEVVSIHPSDGFVMEYFCRKAEEISIPYF